MKKWVFISILPVILISSAGCRRQNRDLIYYNRAYLNVIKDAREEAFFFLARNFVPGSSIALSVDGKLVWSEGMGQASTDLEVPATRSTKYRIGQVTQVLTSLCYHQMAEAGILNPDSSVRKYVPRFPEKNYPLLLHHLADQTSGIRPATEIELFRSGFNISLEEGLQLFYGDTLLFPPGMYQYPSHFNYNLLGAVMEGVAGESFPKVIKRWVTDTLGMDQTVHDSPFITIKNRSNFYDLNLVAQVIHAPTTDLRSRMPSDGYLSTAEDLIILGNALLSSPELSESVKQKMFTLPDIRGEYPPRWGNGFLFLDDEGERKIYLSRGMTKGSGAMLIIDPETRIVLAWLINLNDSGEELPGLKIFNMFRDFKAGRYKKGETPGRYARKQLPPSPGPNPTESQ